MCTFYDHGAKILVKNNWEGIIADIKRWWLDPILEGWMILEFVNLFVINFMEYFSSFQKIIIKAENSTILNYKNSKN